MYMCRCMCSLCISIRTVQDIHMYMRYMCMYNIDMQMFWLMYMCTQGVGVQPYTSGRYMQTMKPRGRGAEVG